MNQIFCRVYDFVKENKSIGTFNAYGTNQQLEFFEQHLKITVKQLETIEVPENIRIFNSTANSSTVGEVARISDPNSDLYVEIVLTAPILPSIQDVILNPLYQDENTTVLVGEGYFQILDTKEWELIVAGLEDCLLGLKEKRPEDFVLNHYGILGKTIEE